MAPTANDGVLLYGFPAKRTRYAIGARGYASISERGLDTRGVYTLKQKCKTVKHRSREIEKACQPESYGIFCPQEALSFFQDNFVKVVSEHA
jgi:hypothetical protein